MTFTKILTQLIRQIAYRRGQHRGQQFLRLQIAWGIPVMAAAKVRSLESIHFILGMRVAEFQHRRFEAAVAHLETLLQFELCERSKWRLDGSEYIDIYFGPSPFFSGYHRPSKLFSKVDSPPFDLKKFLALSGPERDKATMKRVEKALLTASEACGADPKPLLQAVASIRDNDYQGFVPWPKGPTPHPSNEYSAQTGYCVSRDNPHAVGVQLRSCDGRLLQTVEVPREIARVNSFFNGFRKSKWKKNTFCFCTEANRSLYEVTFEALPPDPVVPSSQSRSRKAAASSSSRSKKVAPVRKARDKKRDLEEQMKTCQNLGLAFLKAVMTGDLKSAIALLSAPCRKKLGVRKLKQLVEDFYGCAEPKVNPGTTFEMLEPHLYVNVETEVDADYLADQWPSIVAQKATSHIVAELEIGCEPMAREALSALVDRDGKLWLVR